MVHSSRNMTSGAFPLFKLGYLLVKQISKPIANQIAERAKTSRIFREYICLPTAQLFHWYDVKIRMRILNLGKVSTIPKLDEAKAIETGSQVLSEFIILSIAATYIVFEFRRSSAKEEVKQAEVAREKEEINAKLTNLELEVEEQAAQIRELTRLTHSLRGSDGRKGFFHRSSSSPPDGAKDVSFDSAAGVWADGDEEECGVYFYPPIRKGMIMSAAFECLEVC